jgi:nicotinamidase-related amidase
MTSDVSAPRLWDAFLTDRDRQVFAVSGFGARSGFGERPALLIIDAVHENFGDGPAPILARVGELQDYCGADGWTCVDVIERLAAAFRAKSLPVVYTVPRADADAWRPAPQGYRGEGEPLPMRPEQDVVSRLKPHKTDIIVPKLKPSAFFGTNLPAYLTFLGADSVVVVGAQTSDAVRSTVNDAFSQNYRVIVAEDACCDQSQASHAVNLCDIHAKYADVMMGQEVLDWVASLPEDLFPHRPGA